MYAYYRLETRMSGSDKWTPYDETQSEEYANVLFNKIARCSSYDECRIVKYIPMEIRAARNEGRETSYRVQEWNPGSRRWQWAEAWGYTSRQQAEGAMERLYRAPRIGCSHEKFRVACVTVSPVRHGT